MFRQLFDETSSTLTYLLVDEETKEAVIIDPVKEHIDDYVQLVSEYQLKLLYALETHVHADHVTAGGLLRKRLGVKAAVSQACEAVDADVQLNEGDIIYFGKKQIKVIATPGHTAGSLTFFWQDKLFTGDALLINGCGRTDFQSGDAAVLYDSIANKLFVYPNETLVYPGHDYNGHRVSNIGQEKLINPRLAAKSKEAFIEIMENLNLPKPKLIDIAVPANKNCGVNETELLQG
ncbi:MAG TPA: MBL fold metallo-hydrolase [Methylophilaceae bacterium]|nr:MBL fold metallo-hydrolase [Methylophilaceae bacterium]